MNQTIQTLLSHSSVRDYRTEPITEEIKQILIQSAQAASSSHFIQAYSIIEISDPIIRKEIAQLLDHPKHILEAPLYYVFIADLSRHKRITEMHHVEMASLESEALLIATVDATLAAQNMFVAAESLGLGGVYTGVLRNTPKEISRLLHLPDNSFALFGLCLGYPSKVNEIKPRLPINEILHTNYYNETKSEDNLQTYNKIMEEYYSKRTSNKKYEVWTYQIANYFSSTLRPYMNEFLSSIGFKLQKENYENNK
mgnify:FL=1